MLSELRKTGGTFILLVEMNFGVASAAQKRCVGDAQKTGE
jgi:hypothetical protein